MGPSEQKPIKKFEKQGAWAYPGTAHFLGYPVSGMGKATNFKFCTHIYGVHPNKSPLKIVEKEERERIQGLPNFFWMPPLFSATAKATDFKFSR